MGRLESFNLTANTDIADYFDASLVSIADFARSQVTWTQADVVDLMEAVYPPPSGRAGDQSLLRQQLSSAFLAGVAQCQEELLLKPSRSLALASVQEARTLLKNRAASQDGRLWHAFMAGARAARATVGFAAVSAPGPALSIASRGVNKASRGRSSTADLAQLRLFVRQPLTESGQEHQALIAAVLDRIEEHNGAPHSFRFLTGRKAESADTFRASFESESGQAFTPQAFRAHRLTLLAQADAFVNIRVGMSESSAFELSYHVFRGTCTPVLFLVWKHAPIKTTLLKDLGNLCDVTYLEFEHADDLRAGMGEFFRRCKRRAATAVC